MKKFQFRLDPVLRMREAVRDERRRALSQAYAVEATALEQISGVEDRMLGLLQYRRKMTAERKVNIDSLLSSQRFEAVLKAERRELENNLVNIRKEIEICRQNLIEADRDVKIIEKLKDKKKTEHNYLQEQESMKEIDEMVVMREGNAKNQD